MNHTAQAKESANAAKPSGFSFRELVRHEHLANTGIILLTSFVLNFVFFHSFGMYADDWTYLGHVFRLPYTVTGVLHNIVPYADGRPLQYISDAIIGGILYQTRSISACYLFTAGVMSLGLLSLYVMLVHRFSAFFSLLITILFSVSPLYSIRAFLNGESGFALGFTFLFAGGTLCFRRRYLLAYFSGALVLLTYELFFPLFVFLPILLKPLRSKSDVKRLIFHFATCIGLVAAFAVFKDHYGVRTTKGVTGGASVMVVAFGIVRTDVSYTIHCLWGLVNVPLWLHKLHYSDAIVWAVIGAVACFLFVRNTVKETEFGSLVFGDRTPSSGLELAILALCFIVAGYSLIYFAIGGNTAAAVVSFLDRDSRFHIASSFGASLLVAILLSVLLTSGKGTIRLTMLRAGLVAVYFGLLAGYSVSHQVEFEVAANRQRGLVEQLMALHPSMDPEDTFVIYRPQPAQRDLLAIDEEPHGYYFLLKSMFVWPGAIWPPPGPAIRIVHDREWTDTVKVDAGGNITWAPGVWPATPEKAGHLWYYEQLENGTLQPHFAAILLKGRNILQNSSDSSVVPLSTLRREPFYTDVPVPAPHANSEDVEAATKFESGRPKVDSVSPSSGSGMKQNFLAMLSDTKGTNDLSGVYLMFQPSVQPAHSCWVYFDLGSKSVNLAQDNGSDWMRPIKMGSGVLSNSQCSVFGLGATVQVKGSEIEVNAPVEFKHQFSGSKKIYTWVRTVNNIDSGWLQAGSWVIP